MSICETVPSRLFATQTEPSPTAMPVGPLPTAIGCTTSPEVGSIRTTLLAARCVAQSAPSPKASSVAATGEGFAGAPLSASIRVIVPSPVFATQTEPAP